MFTGQNEAFENFLAAIAELQVKHNVTFNQVANLSDVWEAEIVTGNNRFSMIISLNEVGFIWFVVEARKPEVIPARSKEEYFQALEKALQIIQEM